MSGRTLTDEDEVLIRNILGGTLEAINQLAPAGCDGEPTDLMLEDRNVTEALKALVTWFDDEPTYQEAHMAPKDRDYIEAAQRLHEDEGTLEIDDNAVVSRGGDPGAYVQAWVWVSDDDVETTNTTNEPNEED